MSDDEKTTRELLVRLPVELHTQLKERAEQDDRSIAATVRVALKRYLAEDQA